MTLPPNVSIANNQNYDCNNVKPYFYEIENGTWINIGACKHVNIYKSFGSYYIKFVIGTTTYYFDRKFDSYDEAKEFLQNEILNHV